MDIDYQGLDFSKMVAPCYDLPPKKDPREVYKEVFRFSEYYPESFPQADLGKTIRYIAYVYDRNSPLRQVFNELKKIKLHAAELAGFIRQEDGRFLSNVEDIIACRNPLVNKMIIRYVVTQKSGLYSKYIMYSSLHEVEMEKLLAGDKGAKVNDFDTLSDKLDDVRQELLSHDTTAKLQEDFVSFYFEDKLALRPEDIARRLQRGEPPVSPPVKKKSPKSRQKSSADTDLKTSIA